MLRNKTIQTRSLPAAKTHPKPQPPSPASPEKRLQELRAKGVPPMRVARQGRPAQEGRVARASRPCLFSGQAPQRSGDVLAAGHDEVVPKSLRNHANLAGRASRVHPFSVPGKRASVLECGTPVPLWIGCTECHVIRYILHTPGCCDLNPNRSSRRMSHETCGLE